MTTITFGGGPSTEARRNFSNLKHGTQVPGYGGYIHQIKYTNGHTYGDQTKTLADKYNLNMRTSKSAVDLSTRASGELQFAQEKVYDLPKTAGGVKLTEKMIPGYTGYIPSRKFHFSDTYRVECDTCIDDFVKNKSDKMSKDSSITQYVSSQNKHVAIASGKEIKSNLDHYNDFHPKPIHLQSDKREFTEPPIPGYTGFIPRIVPTEMGLGTRYHNTTQRGLLSFKNDYLRSKSGPNPQALSFETSPVNQSALVPIGDREPITKKIYAKPGMIPKYTGYIHGRKFEFGNTYGNTTRELPVCAHSMQNFGVYMDKNPPKTAIC
jgi:hypothetical protein